MPSIAHQGPALSKYTPNMDFVKTKNKAWTITKEDRFDSLKDLNKIKREQVSPQSYKILESKHIYRPHDKMNYAGKFQRDT